MMRWLNPAMAVVCLLVFSPVLSAQDYTFKVVATGLARPTGIAVDDDAVYFTEVPVPGVGGSINAVKRLDLDSRTLTTLHIGEPEPVNIVVGRDGTIYWVCKSAGVILKQEEDGTTTVFLAGLHQPSGIDVSKKGIVYFTEVPTPGISGGNNGVFAFSGDSNIRTIHLGEPEPVDVAVAPNGDVYWTCRTAGVILVRSAKTGRISVLLSGLASPTGIAVDRKGRYVYYTEVPTPGQGGASGGMNRVVRYELDRGRTTVIHEGDPEPTDIAVTSDGRVYWTCTSAGVIVEATPVRT